MSQVSKKRKKNHAKRKKQNEISSFCSLSYHTTLSASSEQNKRIFEIALIELQKKKEEYRKRISKGDPTITVVLSPNARVS